MFGNLGDMGEMLKKVQEQSNKMEAEMAAKEYSAKAGGGMLEIKMNGKGEVIDVNIDDSLLEDKDSLQILLISCINDVNNMLEKDKQNSAMSMFGDLGDLSTMFGKS